jgi:hypothetical protein
VLERVCPVVAHKVENLEELYSEEQKVRRGRER